MELPVASKWPSPGTSGPQTNLVGRRVTVIFVSLEDETGVVQVIVWKSLREVQRQELLGARLMVVHGTWQREGIVKNLIASRLEDLTPLLGRLAGSANSRDFR